MSFYYRVSQLNTEKIQVGHYKECGEYIGRRETKFEG